MLKTLLCLRKAPQNYNQPQTHKSHYPIATENSVFLQKNSNTVKCKKRTVHTGAQSTVRNLEPLKLQSHTGEEIQGDFYDWKFGSKIHYVTAGDKGPPVLMVHGFGAGSFHFDKNIQSLSENHRVWAVDLLGQGKSWPESQTYTEEGALCLSIETWTMQLCDFIEKIIGEPVFIMGNSLGGHLAVSVAASAPTLCSGLILLNATPFWAFGPNENSAFLYKMWPYNGSFPAPEGIKKVVGGLWWSRLANPTSINALLNLVYSNPVRDSSLVNNIVEATLHPTALDAFVSIVFAPKYKMDFNQMLKKLECPVCMIYGRDDPWVVPLWGQRLKREVPDAVYFELTPSGHCPHHETPEPVNSIVSQWLSSIESSNGLGWGIGESWREKCENGNVITCSIVDGSPRNVFERFDSLVYKLRKLVFG